MMIVNEHINAEDFRKEVERRRELNPVLSKTILSALNERLMELKNDVSFEEAYYIYHTTEAFFYIESFSVKPVGDLDFIFFNDRFIIWGSIFGHHLEFRLGDNKNFLTDEDKKIITRQSIEIIENAEIFLLEDFTRDNMTFYFTGDKK